METGSKGNVHVNMFKKWEKYRYVIKNLLFINLHFKCESIFNKPFIIIINQTYM